MESRRVRGDSGSALAVWLKRLTPPPNDSAHKLHALTYQVHETLGHLRSRNALISTAPAAHVSFTRLLGGPTAYRVATVPALFLGPEVASLFLYVFCGGAAWGRS